VRPIKMYLKDAMIFLDFLKKGIKEDIYSLIRYFLSKNTYTNIFHSSTKTFRRTFFGVKNQLYMSMFVVVLGFMVKSILIKIIVIMLFIIMYARYKWRTGDPIRFYNESYFSGELHRKI